MNGCVDYYDSDIEIEEIEASIANYYWQQWKYSSVVEYNSSSHETFFCRGCNIIFMEIANTMAYRENTTDDDNRRRME